MDNIIQSLKLQPGQAGLKKKKGNCEGEKTMKKEPLIF